MMGPHPYIFNMYGCDPITVSYRTIRGVAEIRNASPANELQCSKESCLPTGLINRHVQFITLCTAGLGEPFRTHITGTETEKSDNATSSS